MLDYAVYVPASILRRLLALVVNVALLTIPLATLTRYLPSGTEDAIAFVSVLIAFMFSVGVTSPGKRLLRLRVLNDHKEDVGPKNHLIRNLPLLAFYGYCVLAAPLFENAGPSGSMIVGGFGCAALLFLVCDWLVALFTPDGRSLMDLRCRTRVYARPSLSYHQPFKVWGLRVW